MDTYPVWEVQSWLREDFEPGGDEQKVWLIDPVQHADVGRDRWLFKPPTINRHKPKKALAGAGFPGPAYQRGEDSDLRK